MKVMIDGNVYDGRKMPVHVFLTDADKRNLANMNPDCKVYSQFPDPYDLEQAGNECAAAREKMEE